MREALAAGGREDLTLAVLDWYGITEAGNWEGTTVLCRPLGSSLRRSGEVEAARRLLLDARRRRPQPARDGKVLTEWNAMAAAVLAEAAGATGNPLWAERAEGHRQAPLRHTAPSRRALAAFAGQHPTGLCRRLCLVGRVLHPAGRADRARRRGRPGPVEAADALLDLFWDNEVGGLFTTGHDAEQLIVRGKDLLDGAMPSANSVAAGALLRLAALTGDDRYRSAGQRIVELAAPLLGEHPTALADMVAASAWVSEGTEVVIAGDRPDLLAVVRRRWLPEAVLAWGEPWDSPLWEGRTGGAAYVCRRFACQAPALAPSTLASQLDAGQWAAGLPATARRKG